MASNIDLKSLSPAERLELIGELWDSLSDEEALPLSASLGEELDRRVREAQATPEAGRPWKAVRADLESE